MAGIAGILSSQPHDLLQQMLEKIHHRGTSEAVIWNGTHAAIGSLGISTLDETLNPVETPSGQKAIVWDGTLINNHDLRKQLSLHNIAGNSEAETILHLYEEFGPQAISQLEGEFALAIVEGNQLLMARDRLGI